MLMQTTRCCILVTIILCSVLMITVYAQSINNKKSGIIDIPPSLTDVKGNFCIDCHSNLEGNLKSVVNKWGKSPHAKKGNKCNICHGGNPGVNDASLSKSKRYSFIGKPGNKISISLCGRGECHDTAINQFIKGPHYQSVLKTGEPNCVTCHGSHNIQHSSGNILSEKTCTACHKTKYSAEIIKLILDIDKKIRKIEKKIEFLRERNAKAQDIEDRFSKIKKLFFQIVHVFSGDDIKFTERIIELEIISLKDNLKTKIAIVNRLDLLYILTLIFSFLLILGFVVYIITIVNRKRR